MLRFLLKKGPADPFRGDWYEAEAEFPSAEKAIEVAMARTMENYRSMQQNWVEYGYEWSVFERTGEVETKIWEGFKFIQIVENEGDKPPHADWGIMNR